MIARLGLLLLSGDNYHLAQAIVDAARAAGYQGILAPSAALPGRETIAVFASALTFVEAEKSKIRQLRPDSPTAANGSLTRFQL